MLILVSTSPTTLGKIPVGMFILVSTIISKCRVASLLWTKTIYSSTPSNNVMSIIPSNNC